MPDIDRLLNQRPPDQEEVIRAMVTLYRASLTRLACSILGDADEAEDAVQRTFVAAASNLGSYQPNSIFKAWLYTIALNQCRGALRKRKTQHFLSRLLGSNAAPTDPGPEAIAERRADSRRIWSAVASLDEKQRIVILLRYEQGMSIREIAEILSIPEKTVYTRLYTAFTRLRGELKDFSNERETPGNI